MPSLARSAGYAFLAAALALTALAGAAFRQSPPGPTPIAWSDLAGHRYTAADLAAPATVFFFTSTECPLSNLYMPRMAELEAAYRGRGARFFLVNSNLEDSRAALRAWAAQHSIRFPVVKDEGTALADRLGARCTPEAVILDAKCDVRFRGQLDDSADGAKVTRRYAQEALDAILAGHPVRTPRTLAAGCAIFRQPVMSAKSARSAARYTYARDVAPILNRNCVVCHRAGEVAPFALETYQQARTWAAPIRDYTQRRVMPPWKAVPGHGDFLDARTLSDRDIATLAAWANAGAPSGDLKQAPPAPKFPPADAWALGTPDQVLQPSRPYHLAAEGPDVYRNFVLPADFTRDTYYSAMEFKPGNRKVVHHVVCYIDTTGKSAALDGHDKEPGFSTDGVGIGIVGAQWGEVWVPGRTPRLLPPGVAICVPKGAKLVMQVHYHKNGAPQTDLTRMALYRAKGPVEKRMMVWPLSNYTFVLRPGEKRQEVRASMTTPAAVHVYTVFPHMHLLGREMSVTATLPDGTVMPLIEVNDWDFNWQETYEYRSPVALPRGTRIDLTAVYDNTDANPRQLLHPPRTVRFGEQTTDEMCFCFLGFTLDRQRLTAAQ